MSVHGYIFDYIYVCTEAHSMYIHVLVEPEINPRFFFTRNQHTDFEKGPLADPEFLKYCRLAGQ